MTRPTSILIGPHKFWLRNGHSPDAIGEMFIDTLTIAIRDGLPPTMEKETVLHETIHALWALAGLPDDIEEQAVQAIGAGMLQVIRDNYALIEWVRA